MSSPSCPWMLEGVTRSELLVDATVGSQKER